MDGESRVALAVGALLGLTGGFVAGYKWASRKMGSEFEERLERETKELRTFYSNVNKKKYPTPEEAVAALVTEEEADEALTDYQGKDGTIMYNKVVKATADTEPLIDIPTVEVERNIFESKSDPEKPYVISQEDFMQGDAGYQQVTVTYYQVDNVLADERDDVIEDMEKNIGLNCLVQFGVASSDENTVHVRNEKIQLDFEVVRHEGSFAQEVLGLDEPMQPPKKSARQRRADGD